MKRFFRITCLSLAIITAFSFYLTRTPLTDNLEVLLAHHAAATQAERVELIADAFVSDYSVPSLVIGIIEDGKAPVFINKGTLERGGEQLVNEHTYYQIGSLSKTFTGIIARNLETTGQLNLSASILEYLPAEFTEVEIEKLRPITVQHVLQHRAGFPRDAPSQQRVPFGGPIINDYELADLISDLKNTSLDHPAGEVVEYSNFGYGVLGAIFEFAAQDSYENLLQRYIAQPYEMQHTTSNFDHDFSHQLPTPYLPELRYVANQPFNFGRIAPAGGIFSSATDLAHLLQTQMEVYQQNDTTHPLFLTEHTEKFFNEDWSPDYGYGFFKFTERGDKEIFGHNGDVDGFASSYTFYPEKGIGLVMLTSMGGEWFANFERTLRPILM